MFEAILEEQRAHPADFRLLLDEDFEILIDDGDGEQDPGPGPDRPNEVGHDREGADAQTAERGRRRNVSETTGASKSGIARRKRID